MVRLDEEQQVYRDMHQHHQGMGATMMFQAPPERRSDMQQDHLGEMGGNQQHHMGFDSLGMQPASQPGGSGKASKRPKDGGNDFSIIFPRRKSSKNGSATAHGPVLITLKVLGKFANKPLGEAAKALGISATALKKACRKLGNNRWPVKPPTSADTPKGGPSPIGVPMPPVRMPSPTPSATSSSQTNSSGGRGMYPMSAGISPAGGAQWPNWAPSKPSDSSSAPGSASDSDGSTNGSSSTDRNSQNSGSHRGTKGGGRDTATSRGNGKQHPSGQEKQRNGGIHSSGNNPMDPAMQMTWWGPESAGGNRNGAGSSNMSQPHGLAGARVPGANGSPGHNTAEREAMYAHLMSNGHRGQSQMHAGMWMGGYQGYHPHGDAAGFGGPRTQGYGGQYPGGYSAAGRGLPSGPGGYPWGGVFPPPGYPSGNTGFGTPPGYGGYPQLGFNPMQGGQIPGQGDRAGDASPPLYHLPQEAGGAGGRSHDPHGWTGAPAGGSGSGSGTGSGNDSQSSGSQSPPSNQRGSGSDSNSGTSARNTKATFESNDGTGSDGGSDGNGGVTGSSAGDKVVGVGSDDDDWLEGMMDESMQNNMNFMVWQNPGSGAGAPGQSFQNFRS